ncbi:MAG: hypothetical protein IKW58_00065 [Alphaproteobacteria bacterium]|nr:hypothetical protein [Alphaproteobacteria bacterium]
MKKVLTAITCSLLVACSCNENQWEEVDNVSFEETVYIEPAPIVVEDNVVVEPAPVYVQAPQPVYDCPCAEVQPQPCYQPTCYQPCGCGQVVQAEPKVTKTKKIITTTTTYEEPCGKDVCEPVVTVHEEIIADDGQFSAPEVPAVKIVQGSEPFSDIVVEKITLEQPKVKEAQNEYVEVTVEKTPYRADVVEMKAKTANVSQGTTTNYSPEAYIVVATRATNRMLQDTATLYENGTKRVYIKDIKLLSSDLPYGSHRLKGATKDIISGSQTFDVVNNINNAEFVIEPSAEWYIATSNATPAIQYKLSLLDKAGKKIDEWIEIIRQVKE